MGWDIQILNRPYSSSGSNIVEEPLSSFGLRRDIMLKLDNLFLGIEWEEFEDSIIGHLSNDYYFGNIDLGEIETMDGKFWLGVYGGNNPMNLIVTLCRKYNWSAYDTTSSEYLDIDSIGAVGWNNFLKFRADISSRLSKGMDMDDRLNDDN